MTPCLRLVPVAVAVMWNPLIPSSAAACPARPVTPEALLMYTLILSGVIVSTGPAVLIGVGAGVVPGRGVSSRIDFHNASAAGSIALGYGPGDSPRPAPSPIRPGRSTGRPRSGPPHTARSGWPGRGPRSATWSPRQGNGRACQAAGAAGCLWPPGPRQT